MYCRYCKVNVESSKDICPLCHNKIDGIPQKISVFPEKKLRKFKTPMTFTRMYWFIALSVIILCGTINIVNPTNVLWSLIVGLSLAYLYFLIKNTIMYKGSGGSKIYVQTVTLSFFNIALQYILHTKEWAFSYAVPIIVIASLLIQVLFVSIFNKKSNQYVRYMAYTSIIGIVPAILYLCKVINFPYLAYVSFVMSAVTLIGLLFFMRKSLFNEFKKKGHI